MEHIGKYRIIKLLGQGGFGAVYLAEDPRLHEQVAIKVFDIKDDNLARLATSATADASEVLQSRFLNEAKTLRRLADNAHIVDVYDFGELPDGQPYYVMPYLPCSLKDELGNDATNPSVIAELPPEEKPRPLVLSTATDYLQQLLSGLKTVHDAGLVHRDIKPANLLITDKRIIKLCDFGIAKVPDTEHSHSGVGMGSRNYMSPEQRQSAKHVDARSDVYSVGVLAYRMLTGTLPEGRFSDPITWQPAMSQDLNQWVLKALEQNPSSRFADAGDMLQALKKCNSDSGIDDERGTGTWIEEGRAEIKSELKPLETKIIESLKGQGEIPDKDLKVLEALAGVAGLDDKALNDFIGSVLEDLSRANAQTKGLINWISSLNALKVRHPKQIPDGELSALLEAGNSLTDKSTEQLSRLLLNKGVTQKQLTRIQHNTGQSDTAGDAVKGKPKKSSGGLIAAVLILTVLAGGGYYGFTLYQQEQEKQRQAEIAKRNEQSAWQQAQQLNTIESYQLYLDTWPEGQHAAEAQKEQDKLREAARLARLSAEQQQAERVTQAQQKLKTLGYTIVISGALNARTRKTIEAFEQEEGLAVVGEVDATLLQALDTAITREDNAAFAQAEKTNTIESYEQYLSDKPAGSYRDKASGAITQLKEAQRIAREKAEAKRRDETAWQRATKTNTLEGYKAYQQSQPEGLYLAEAQARIEAIELENSKVALTINVTPQDAKIEILNIKERYRPGIRLLPNRTYDIRLSKQGYESQTHFIVHNQAQTLRYTLEQTIPPSIQNLMDSMVSIPGGSFMMGSENGDGDEKPVHRVNINPFRLMEHEVTWAMYQPCIDAGVCPEAKDKGWGKGNRPIINVSWNDITQKYIPWLNQQTGQTFRLPSEAEWEYAARAGSTTKYSWGDSINCSQARYGYYSDECGKQISTDPVKSFQPNAFGLYDMHGNVWEWVQDCWNASYSGAPANGRAWMQGDCGRAVLRGGSWLNIPYDLRSAGRGRDHRSDRRYADGFRLAQDL